MIDFIPKVMDCILKLRNSLRLQLTAGQAKKSHVLPIFLYKGDKDDLSKQLLELEVDSQVTNTSKHPCINF